MESTRIFQGIERWPPKIEAGLEVDRWPQLDDGQALWLCGDEVRQPERIGVKSPRPQAPFNCSTFDAPGEPGF